MVEINNTDPLLISSCTPYTFTVKINSTGFGQYVRQGVVENTKVAKKMEFHSWEQSYLNPSASTHFGMLEPPDLAKFGRSE